MRGASRGQRYAEQKESGKASRRAVHNSSEIPHLWAHKVQEHARTSNGHLYFQGDTIYSYGLHFPIARHVTNKAGKTAVLFTTAHYSVTTSAHCSHVRSACSHLTIFNVPNVNGGRYSDNKDNVNHADNLKDYAARISNYLLREARARSSESKEWNHKKAGEIRTQALAYAKFFGLAYAKILPKIPALDSAALARIKQVEQKRQADQRAKILKESAEAIAKWRAGESVNLPHGLPDMLRVKRAVFDTGHPIPDHIETSRGVSFPISHAKRGLALVRAVRARGEAWQTNGHTCKLGHYQIDSIDAEGNVKAGCHTVSFSEISRIADAIDAAPTVLESLEQSAE